MGVQFTLGGNHFKLKLILIKDVPGSMSDFLP